MRDRLVELLLEDVGCEKDGRGDCSVCEYKYSEDGCIKHLATLLADHLLANGVIVPPCKVGDIIYALNYDGNGYMPLSVTSRESLVRWMEEDQFGNTLFINREEAEQALKGEHHAEIHRCG